MPTHVQQVSALAWSDERHVIENRVLYREKFETVTPMLAEALPIQSPQAGFYYWPATPIDDESFTQRLFVEQNVTVLPGRYLSRAQHGLDPGSGRVRMAMVAPLAECVAAAQRIVDFVKGL